jgi:hypothetical protein
MDFFRLEFSAGELAHHTGVMPSNIQSYLKRNIWTPPTTVNAEYSGLQGGGVKGKHRRFSIFSLLDLAYAKTMIDMGMSAQEAFKWTWDIAYTGGSEFMDSPERWAGLPFPPEHGLTIFAFSGAANRTWLGCDKSILDGINTMGAGGVGIVPVSKVFEAVCRSLELDPALVLEEAYSETMPDHGSEWPEAED